MSDPAQQVLVAVLSNFITFVIAALGWLNVQLFSEYVMVIMWALVIAEGLHSSKATVLRWFATIDDPAPETRRQNLISVTLGHVGQSVSRETVSGQHRLVELALHHSVGLFATLGALSITLRILPAGEFALGAVLLAAPTLALVWLLDRSLVAVWRACCSDDSSASLFVVSTKLCSLSFIVACLGTESLIEGFYAFDAAAVWVRDQFDDEANKQAWGEEIGRARAFAGETFDAIEAEHSAEVWWPWAMAVKSFLEGGGGAGDAGDGCEWWIRANQGHTLRGLDPDKLLTRVSDPAALPVVLHGTYRVAWPLIKKGGLSRMKRNHVHFAPGLPGAGGVISGMRASAELLVYVDAAKAIAVGVEFFVSEHFFASYSPIASYSPSGQGAQSLRNAISTGRVLRLGERCHPHGGAWPHGLRPAELLRARRRREDR